MIIEDIVRQQRRRHGHLVLNDFTDVFVAKSFARSHHGAGVSMRKRFGHFQPSRDQRSDQGTFLSLYSESFNSTLVEVFHKSFHICSHSLCFPIDEELFRESLTGQARRPDLGELRGSAASAFPRNGLVAARGTRQRERAALEQLSGQCPDSCVDRSVDEPLALRVDIDPAANCECPLEGIAKLGPKPCRDHRGDDIPNVQRRSAATRSQALEVGCGKALLERIRDEGLGDGHGRPDRHKVVHKRLEGGQGQGLLLLPNPASASASRRGHIEQSREGGAEALVLADSANAVVVQVVPVVVTATLRAGGEQRRRKSFPPPSPSPSPSSSSSSW
mmetsp:Transcript_42586/g.129236  ORF Transcript_42586/g.129236 Transcript_42586/m.129236 type:complete len:332 (-) Transcript_42586:387-1382(-)